MKVTGHFDIRLRGTVVTIDALPPGLNEGSFVHIHGAPDRRWEVTAIEHYAIGRERCRGKPAGLLLRGAPPLPAVDSHLELAP